MTSEGRLLLTAGGLLLYSSTGKRGRRILLPTGLYPEHAVQAPSGEFIVTLKEGTTSCVLHQLTSAGGQLRWRDISALLDRSGPYQITTPRLAVDSRGRVYLVEFYSSNLLVLDATLQVVPELGSRLPFIGPTSIAFSHPDRLIILSGSTMAKW